MDFLAEHESTYILADSIICKTPPSKIPIKMHCGICEKRIAKNHRHVYCNSCNREIHIKCNKFDAKTYNEHLKNENKSVICTKCQSEGILFQHLTDLQFCAVNKGLNTDTEVLQEAKF